VKLYRDAVQIMTRLPAAAVNLALVENRFAFSCRAAKKAPCADLRGYFGAQNFPGD